MLKKWDQCRCGADNLYGRNIHKIDVFSRHNRIVTLCPGLNRLNRNSFVLIKRNTDWYGNLVFLILSRKHQDGIGHLTFINNAIRSLYKPFIINLGIHRQRRDQPDIRTFRSFDRAKPSVVSIVNVTNLKTCTFAGKTTRSKGRNPSFVGHFSQRIGLIHEL